MDRAEMTGEAGKSLVRRMFNVPGETWVEIGAGMLASFSLGLNAAFDSTTATMNEVLKAKMRQIFSVDGGTWGEIAFDIVQGFGLGLVICRDIVAGFGGELSLRPTGDGTSFVVVLETAR